MVDVVGGPALEHGDVATLLRDGHLGLDGGRSASTKAQHGRREEAHTGDRAVEELGQIEVYTESAALAVVDIEHGRVDKIVAHDVTPLQSADHIVHPATGPGADLGHVVHHVGLLTAQRILVAVAHKELGSIHALGVVHRGGKKTAGACKHVQFIAAVLEGAQLLLAEQIQILSDAKVAAVGETPHEHAAVLPAHELTAHRQHLLALDQRPKQWADHEGGQGPLRHVRGGQPAQAMMLCDRARIRIRTSADCASSHRLSEKHLDQTTLHTNVCHTGQQPFAIHPFLVDGARDTVRGFARHCRRLLRGVQPIRRDTRLLRGTRGASVRHVRRGKPPDGAMVGAGSFCCRDVLVDVAPAAISM
mmetsp:Transcript_38088/g.95835  ORF Transcript_38088/g.95835 Transcript_38088/m.95835 type:complete len:361 (+) Transcript_38088:226-1308(+)